MTFAASTPAEHEVAMVAAGVPQPIAAQNAQAFALTADGDAEWLSDDAADLLGRPARSFRDFIDDHREAFAGAR